MRDSGFLGRLDGLVTQEGPKKRQSYLALEVGSNTGSHSRETAEMS